MKTAKYFTDKVIYFLAICVTFSFLFQMFHLRIAANVVYGISLLVVFFCYIASGAYNYIALLMVILTTIATVIHGFRFEVFDYYTHVVISLCIYMCFDVSAYIKLKYTTFKKIANLFLLTALVLIAAYYFGSLKYTHFNGFGSISLNLHNPNAAGMWVACIFILLV